MTNIRKLALLALACPLASWAQSTTPIGTPAQVVVTIGHHYGEVPPTLTRDDLAITQHYDPLPVTNVTPLRGNRAALEMFLLVDQCSNCEPGSKFEELSRFIASLPSTTRIGTAYIQNGKLQIAQSLTADHRRAVEALSTPAGSKPASPFSALAELIRGWPKSGARRAVLMISNGLDPAGSNSLPRPLRRRGAGGGATRGRHRLCDLSSERRLSCERFFKNLCRTGSTGARGG